jgi:hypothetical protein
VCVNDPLDPVIVNVNVPCFIDDDVVIVSVEDVPDVGLGLNEPEAPDGKPETLKVTEPEKPFCGVIVTV